MAFLPLFSGRAYPRGKHHETITLMEYIDNFDKNHPRPARKYCYIVKSSDLQKIFNNVGITLTEERRVKRSFWNRRHPVEGKEYGVEICEDEQRRPEKLL